MESRMIPLKKYIFVYIHIYFHNCWNTGNPSNFLGNPSLTWLMPGYGLHEPANSRDSVSAWWVQVIMVSSN